MDSRSWITVAFDDSWLRSGYYVFLLDSPLEAFQIPQIYLDHLLILIVVVQKLRRCHHYNMPAHKKFGSTTRFPDCEG